MFGRSGVFGLVGGWVLKVVFVVFCRFEIKRASSKFG